jgi:hypothetical protein
MFRTLRDRFSTDDAARAEKKKARKAKTVERTLRRNEANALRRGADRKSGRHHRGTGGGGS